MNLRAVAAFAPLLLLAGPLGACATIVEGTDQPVNIVTAPAGASCTLTRKGKVIGQVSPTPGPVMVEKSKNDIFVDCRKDGYQPAQFIAKSDFTGWTFGNIILGGIIGVGVDAASGANNEYQDSVTITLTPLELVASPPVPTPTAKAVPTS